MPLFRRKPRDPSPTKSPAAKGVGNLASKGLAMATDLKGLASGAGAAALKGAGAVGAGLTGIVPLGGSKAAPASDEEVVARTPQNRWFKPSTGWSSGEFVATTGNKETKDSPPLLLPTHSALRSNSRLLAPIGELRIEVLEAEGLRAKDVLSKPDPYAVALFEGCAARTAALPSTTRPRWAATHARAFAFPVSVPYSCAYIALRDGSADLASELANGAGTLVGGAGELVGRAGGLAGAGLATATDVKGLAKGVGNLAAHGLAHATDIKGLASDAKGLATGAGGLALRGVAAVGTTAVKGVAAVGTTAVKGVAAVGKGVANVGVGVVGTLPLGVSTGGAGDLGRVVLELSTLTPGTEYDCWHPLQSTTFSDKAGRRGWLRLRVSLRFVSERARLLRYVRPPLPPEFVLPFERRADLRAARLAYKGAAPPTSYKWRVLKAHLHELSDLADALVDDVLGVGGDVLFWRGRAAVVSALLCATWQLLVGHPQYVPAAVPLLGVLYLQQTYARQVRIAPLAASPGAMTLLKGLLMGKAPPPLNVTSRAAAGGDAALHTSSVASGVATDAKEGEAVAEAEGSAAHGIGGLGDGLTATEAEAGGEDDSASEADSSDDELSQAGMPKTADLKIVARFTAPKGSLRAKTAEIKKAVRAEVKGMIDEELPRVVEGDDASTLGGAAGKVGKNLAKLNPLAMLLGPLQNTLGNAIVPAREVQRLLTWHDNVATLWLCVALCALSLGLALVPWALVLRVAGLALLGPHMHLVGRRLAQQAAQDEKREREYAGASAAQRARTVEFVRVEEMNKAKADLEKVQAQLRQRTMSVVEADAILAAARHNLIVRPSRTAAHICNRPSADPFRSCAYAAPEGW